MDKALYISMSAAKNNMQAQSIHANNLANVNTSGFRSDFAQARSMPIYYGEGYPTRAYALTENPATNFSSGPLVETGRSLDVAVESDGFIAVQGTDGLEAYTRAGSLFIDSVGILRTGNGLPVIGNGGPIAIPAAQKVDIAANGTISIVPQGEGGAAVAVVERIKLVNPPIDELEKSEDGLIRPKNLELEIPADANVKVVSGFIEGSNVNAIHEMTSMLSLARQFEMQVKMMQKVEENSESSARLLQQS